MIEIDQECAGIARIVEAEIQQAQIPDEYEIQFGKTQEIGNSSNPRLSIEYGRNSIRKSISNRYPLKVFLIDVTKIKGRIFNGIEWKYQEILIQTGATANHISFPEMSNMDNQTKILVNRIYERMKIVDESIDEKSQKLFKIRDELSKLSEQSRMLQFDLNQLRNFNPNKVARDVPLALSAQNISKVGKQHPKEEEYLTFTRYIYNLPEESGETFGVLGTTSLFPRISIFLNGLPSFTAQLFEFGYLDRVYTKPNLKELSQLSPKLFKQFFSISMEGKDLQAYYPTLNYISIEKIKDFNVKATGDHDWVLITRGKFKSKELKERILDIELHRLGATEETWKLTCKMLDHDHP
ncbi:hypothetical protein H5410_042587 [Solanum commersonii]|uniref:Uncharacterized protein n=1 Tax=Solanum commersonii TaxID=4109 RepID=A0A9J5XV55_SOLCO|nr:hypothetical protein H5410_042587 [Solanum commersonii]